jgi:hypothetical protein
MMRTVVARVTWLEQPAGPAVAVNSTSNVPTVHVLPLRWQRYVTLAGLVTADITRGRQGKKYVSKCLVLHLCCMD